MIAALVAGFETDFAKLLISVIHDRACKTSTTYSFTYFIFQLCRDTGVSDALRTSTGTVDIGLIRDEDNVAASRRGP